MMKNIALTILIILFYGCSTQKIIKEYEHPKTQITMKMLNVEVLAKSKSKITKTYEISVNRISVGIIKEDKYNSIDYKKVNFKTNDIIEITSHGRKLYRYIKTNPEKDIQEWYLFYVNGVPYIEGIIFTGMQERDFRGNIQTPYEFNIGVWNYYNEDGSLIKSIDYDSYFKFKFEDVLDFIEKNKLLLIDRVTKSHKKIKRNVVDGKGRWNLFLKETKDINGDLYNVIGLDGDTGEVIFRGLRTRGSGYPLEQ